MAGRTLRESRGCCQQESRRDGLKRVRWRPDQRSGISEAIRRAAARLTDAQAAASGDTRHRARRVRTPPAPPDPTTTERDDRDDYRPRRDLRAAKGTRVGMPRAGRVEGVDMAHGSGFVRGPGWRLRWHRSCLCPLHHESMARSRDDSRDGHDVRPVRGRGIRTRRSSSASVAAPFWYTSARPVFFRSPGIAMKWRRP
jgi:hypothetical protein